MSFMGHPFSISNIIIVILLIDVTTYDEEIKGKHKYLDKCSFKKIQEKHLCQL